MGAMIKSLLVSIPLLAVAGAAAAADPQIMQSGGTSSQAITFDNWEIRQGLVDHSYLLIGQSRGRNGHFWLSCDANGLVNIAVPINEKDGRDRLRSYPVTIWSDQRQRQELNFIVFENFVAVAMDYGGGQNAKLETFLNALQTAKQTFTISYNSNVFEFDVAAWPAAQARFTQLCGRRATRMSIR